MTEASRIIKPQVFFLLSQVPAAHIDSGVKMTRKLGPVQDLPSLMKQLFEQGTTNPEQRDNVRYIKSVSLMIHPLDSDFQSCTDPFWTLSRDIHSRGVGFVHHEVVNHSYVRVRLLDYDITMIGRVCHNTPIADCQMYLIGVEFLQNE